MTAAEFRAALKSCGLRQREFAARLGVSISTVNRWALGQVPVPRYAIMYLAATQKLAEMSAVEPNDERHGEFISGWIAALKWILDDV